MVRIPGVEGFFCTHKEKLIWATAPELTATASPAVQVQFFRHLSVYVLKFVSSNNEK